MLNRLPSICYLKLLIVLPNKLLFCVSIAFSIIYISCLEDNWSRFVVAARGTLGGMLGSNNYSQHIKDEIHEALQLDATLPNIQPKGQVVLDA